MLLGILEAGVPLLLFHRVKVIGKSVKMVHDLRERLLLQFVPGQVLKSRAENISDMIGSAVRPC